MPAAIICFESFRAERDRRRTTGSDGEAAEASPFRDRLARVILNARQIAHRRAMLEFGDRHRPVRLAPFREARTGCE